VDDLGHNCVELPTQVSQELSVDRSGHRAITVRRFLVYRPQIAAWRQSNAQILA
jgi:hypothetical protein